jgi:spermidine synthase
VLLAVIGLLYFLAWRRKAATVAVLAVITAAGLGSGAWGIGSESFGNPSFAEIFRGNSNFGMLQVLQEKDRPYRLYLTDYLIQNTYDVTRGRSVSMFTYMLEGLARAYSPRLQRVLCIGMGVGIVPRDLARQGVDVDVVEINPAVVPVARRFFDLDPGAFHLTIGDGRQFLNTAEGPYDAVILDAFNGDSSPSHLLTREAFTSIRRVMSPDGVMVMNSFADLSPSNDRVTASIARTLRSVFGSLHVHGLLNGNTLFVASPRAELSFLHQPVFTDVHAEALSEVRQAYDSQWDIDLSHGIVLTDDYNPLDFWDAANREKYRRTLALSMRNRQ